MPKYKQADATLVFSPLSSPLECLHLATGASQIGQPALIEGIASLWST